MMKMKYNSKFIQKLENITFFFFKTKLSDFFFFLMGLQHESVLVFIWGFIMAVKNSLISGCMSFLIEFLNYLTADTLCASRK